jgi:hypothetical protein
VLGKHPVIMPEPVFKLLPEFRGFTAERSEFPASVPVKFAVFWFMLLLLIHTYTYLYLSYSVLLPRLHFPATLLFESSSNL